MTRRDTGRAPTPSSLLFLSCDLVSSTVHKEKSPAWRRTFLTFYRGFPQALADEVVEQSVTIRFDLWKIIGDEMIFTCQVRDEEGITLAVRIWLEAMTSYEENTLQPEGMRLRGGAFLATFPGPDTRIAVPLDPLSERSDKGVVELNDIALAEFTSASYLRDYVGPSIDIGFKVLRLSDARHFSISVEVAWAMTQFAVDALAGDFTDLRIFGMQGIASLWKNGTYPHLAIDREDEIEGHGVEEAIRLLTLTNPAADEVRALCKSYHNDSDWPSGIYLPDSEVPEFRIEPTDCLYSLRTNAMEGAESPPEIEPKRPLTAKRAKSALDSRAGLT